MMALDAEGEDQYGRTINNEGIQNLHTTTPRIDLRRREILPGGVATGGSCIDDGILESAGRQSGNSQPREDTELIGPGGEVSAAQRGEAD
jgi:hypothetical protein